MAKVERVLGLDLGANSLGWAIVEFSNKKPKRLLVAGSHVFDAGVDGMLERGRDEPRAVERRNARLRRRQTDRQARRMANVAGLLQRAGLFPECDVHAGGERHEALVTLDQSLHDAHANGSPDGVTQLPYYLRARALDEALTPFELGRAFYHLAQRRGFLSNRRAGNDDEDSGQVKPAISQLAKDLAQTKSRTLGEYLSKLDAEAGRREKRLRKRWTGRDMYLDEFERIWEAQAPRHSDTLTDRLKKKLYRAIFHQRPLKSQKGLVGHCELQPGERRAPWASVPAQRFRYWQKINDLEVLLPDGERRPLTADERTTLASALEQAEDLSFATIRKVLDLKKLSFNLEEGGEKKLKGNTTAARMRKVFGDRWDDFDDRDQAQLISEVLGIQKETTMKRRGIEVWGLDAANAGALANLRLEQGYCSLSRKAILRILPHMQKGLRFAEAKKEVYGGEDWNKLVCDALPPLSDTAVTIRNPAVSRALTEMRKVVNSIIREYGKPDTIRLEMARGLKNPREKRKRMWQDNRDREKHREAAKRKILQQLGNPQPSVTDIQKVLLAEECNWECPYTGKSIGMQALLGDTPQFDIEHIVPFSLSLNDSMINKTLCYHEYNRSVKGNKLPAQAAHGDEWDAIVERVKRFKGPLARAKLEWFQMKSVPEGFVERQMNDTRYAAKEAQKYLGLLYGEAAPKHVEATSGRATGYLRMAWNLNTILGDGGEKSREDHRHHAVDAVTIALTTRGMMQQLSRAAEQAKLEKGRVRGWWKFLDPPWPSFLEDAQRIVHAINTSHRVTRKVMGRLHEDTNYTPARTDKAGVRYVGVRKPLDDKFKRSDAEAIVDPAVRAAVLAHLDAHGDDSKAAFADSAKHPRLPNGYVIHRARIRRNEPTFAVGEGNRERHVTTDANHHIEIVEVDDGKGGVKWEGHVVSRFEAVRRVRRGEPVVKRDHGRGKQFVSSLVLGDCVSLDEHAEGAGLFRVAGISQFSAGAIVLDLKQNNDARPVSKVSRKGRTRTPDTFRKSGGKKLVVDHLGNVRQSGD